jgi:hypothetical protein
VEPPVTAVKKMQLVEIGENLDKTKPSVDQLAEYFYRISNHEELFRVGKGFNQEVKKGIKNFAFTSTGYKNSQQRTILGLCCYFDQNANYKIAIVSDHLSQGIFSELLDSSKSQCYSMQSGEDSVNYKSFHHHFDFFDYSEFSKFYDNHLYTNNFDDEVKKILGNYDVVFWDIPEMENMKTHPHFHYRISHLYESLTVIVSQKNTSGKQIESIKNFFSNYNINLNGVLFDSTGSVDKPKRKKIFGLF